MKKVLVDCQTINMFRFRLPEQDIGRNDITLYIEYGVNINNRKQVAYSVWAQLDNVYARMLLFADIFNGTIGEDIVSEIVKHINSNKEFYKQLYKFIEQVDK